MAEPVLLQDVKPSEGERSTMGDTALFIAHVERLIIRVKSAKLKDHDSMLQNLQAWIDRAMSGALDVSKTGDEVVETLTQGVDEMIHTRTLLRRVVNPLAGMALLGGALWAFTAWAVLESTLFLGTPVQIVLAAAIFGVAGSAFRVLLRTVLMQNEHTDRGALLVYGLARPLVGGVLAMAVFATFGAGIISLPIVSDQTTETPIVFLSGLGGGGVLVGQLAMFAFAFAAGFIEGYVVGPMGRGVARVASRIGEAGNR